MSETGTVEGVPEQELVPEKDESSSSSSPPTAGALLVVGECAWITVFSILGVLTRLGLESLNDYPGHILPPLVLAQFVGCAIMGAMTRDAIFFPVKKGNALYVGITSGYCGSVTSFSSWILQVYADLANTAGANRPRGYNVITVFAEVMITLAASFLAYRLGTHMADYANRTCTVHAIPHLRNRALMLLLVLVAIACQAGAILAAALRRDWRGSVAFAMVFGPAGALTRWYLSRTLNNRLPVFPLGTFAANMTGTLLEAVFHLLQYRVASGNACALLQGVQDGYCGTLTTVSTWTVELFTLQRSHAYRYGTLTVVIALVLYVLIDGLDYWIHGSASGYYARCTY